MQFSELFSFIFLALIFASNVCESQDCGYPLKTITVSQSGNANFKTILSAINSVPLNNSQWIHLQISPGVYREHILIPKQKPCIYLEGAGATQTRIEWAQKLSPSFFTRADNTIAKDITFVNTLNTPDMLEQSNVIQAPAVKVKGDKCVFVNCAFLGVQDTLYDKSGRHYYHNCYIQGAVDFIYGSGQTIYEACTIYFSTGKSNGQFDGSFTAQERDSAEDTGGFVFINCNITGTGGKATLGRSLFAYSRVIIANSFLSDVVRPEGWDATTYKNKESTITYVEAGNKGPGANQSNRVKWMKHLSQNELDEFLNISYIDKEGWMKKLPEMVLT